MDYQLEIRLEKAEHALRVSREVSRTLLERLEALEVKVSLRTKELQELLAKAGGLTR